MFPDSRLQDESRGICILSQVFRADPSFHTGNDSYSTSFSRPAGNSNISLTAILWKLNIIGQERLEIIRWGLTNRKHLKADAGQGHAALYHKI